MSAKLIDGVMVELTNTPSSECPCKYCVFGFSPCRTSNEECLEDENSIKHWKEVKHEQE